MSALCFQCGKALTCDDVGIYKRLVNRGSKKFLCIHCLSVFFQVEEPLILERIEFYKKQGCTLFQADQPNS